MPDSDADASQTMSDVLVPVEEWHVQIDGTVLAQCLANEFCLRHPTLSVPPVHLPQPHKVPTNVCPRRCGGPPLNIMRYRIVLRIETMSSPWLDSVSIVNPIVPLVFKAHWCTKWDDTEPRIVNVA